MSASPLPRRPDPALLETLRAHIRRLEGQISEDGETAGVWTLGAPEIDDALPWGGLPRAALHEVLGSSGAASGFCAGLLARRTDRGENVLWCRRRHGIYGPGLALFGIEPARLILVRGRRDIDIFWAMEEGLRSRSLAAVLGEVDSLAPTAARRLQLAAETSGVTALLLRPANETAAATPAVTRWQVSPAPGVPRPGRPGMGFPRWCVELARCRSGSAGLPRIHQTSGEARSWLVEWQDGTTRGFAVAADLRHRPAESAAQGVAVRRAV